MLISLDCSKWRTWDRNFGSTQLHGSPLVASVASPTHPSAQDDVGTSAAKAQTANAQAEGFGESGLMETLCPFQLFYAMA